MREKPASVYFSQFQVNWVFAGGSWPILQVDSGGFVPGQSGSKDAKLCVARITGQSG